MNKYLKTNELKPHPKNIDIYGDNEIEELGVSIKKYGIQNPIIINKNKVIISGHRRFQVAKMIDLDAVPVIEKEFSSEAEELQYLILENQYRIKTNYQKVREGVLLEEIESLKAKNRKANKTEEMEKGRTQNIVGKKIGLSGSSYKRGKKVLDKIEILNKEGNKDEAKELTNEFNKSIYGAVKKVEESSLVIDVDKKDYKKRVEKQKEYNYIDDINIILTIMKTSQDRIEKNLRTKTIPEGLKKFLNGMRYMYNQINTWLPENNVICPKCNGTNMRSVNGKEMNCMWCHMGKTGEYRGMNNE